MPDQRFTSLSKAGGENLTLSDSELESCHPRPVHGGRKLRAYCPFHGSDHRRSLEVDTESGRFRCFACGAWGYTEDAKSRWRQRATMPANEGRSGLLHVRRRDSGDIKPARADLKILLGRYQAALPDSRGASYLLHRGISLEMARYYGLGYAARGAWIHECRNWTDGRVVFPHTDCSGQLINLYGRAAGEAPKEQRHDHLPGAKGYFNTAALVIGEL
jgi:hypothetical protein